jgi:hypothetical protein
MQTPWVDEASRQLTTSGGPPAVVAQGADLRDGGYETVARRPHFWGKRRVAFEQEMRLRVVAVPGGTGKEPPHASSVEQDDVVQALSTYCPDETIAREALPRRPLRDHGCRRADVRLEVHAVDAVTVAKQKTRCFLVGRRPHDLLGGSARGRVRGDAEMNHSPPR